MAYKITHFLPNELILIVTYQGENVEKDIPGSTAEIAQLLEGHEGPIYRIADFCEAQVNFSTLTLGMAQSTQGIPGSFSDPRMRPIFVGSDELVRLGAESAKQEQYGQLDIIAFASLDEALTYARQQIAEKD